MAIPIDKNKMSTTYRSVTTFNGYPFDVAKSALQKYIRRGNVKKACYIACELDMFRFFPEGKSCFTNFYNRLRVIMLEDIGLGCPDILPVVNILFSRWIKSKVFSPELIQVVKILCLCRHSRAYSHLRASAVGKEGIPAYVHELGRDECLRREVNNLVWCIENRNENAMFWILSILGKEKLVEKRCGSTRPGFLVFDIVKRVCGNSQIVEICEEWYKTLKVKEQFLCCVHAVYVSMLRRKKVGEIEFSCGTSIRYYKKVLSGKVILIDDYVYDMHTRKGKSMGRNSADFAIEGSLVCCEKILYKNMYENYIRKKIESGKIGLESKEFVLKARAQLICSGARPDTYFATNRIGQSVVVKGPYLREEDAMMSFKIMSIFRLLKGISTFDVNVKLLIPDMFNGVNNPSTPLGCRTKIQENKPYYFVVMEDVMGKSEYPCIEKESKLWPATRVVDYDTLFANGEFGFGTSSEMSEEARFSFLLQITIRSALKIGDFATRNFLRVGNKVYNLDIEGVGVGNSIRFAKDEKKLLLKTLKANRERYDAIITEWIDDEYVHIMVKLLFGADIRPELKRDISILF